MIRFERTWEVLHVPINMLKLKCGSKPNTSLLVLRFLDKNQYRFQILQALNGLKYSACIYVSHRKIRSPPRVSHPHANSSPSFCHISMAQGRTQDRYQRLRPKRKSKAATEWRWFNDRCNLPPGKLCLLWPFHYHIANDKVFLKKQQQHQRQCTTSVQKVDRCLQKYNSYTRPSKFAFFFYSWHSKFSCISHMYISITF